MPPEPSGVFNKNLWEGREKRRVHAHTRGGESMQLCSDDNSRVVLVIFRDYAAEKCREIICFFGENGGVRQHALVLIACR